MSDYCSTATAIKPINEVEVRRIVAGQAITDLASCVKELVDNALDAGSKSIQIKLFNQGFDAVEVSDNGTGIAPENRALVAEKHATSKLRQFSDLFAEGDDFTTLGFRGEALFCLANISESLCIITRHNNEVVGKKLWYTRDGKLDESRSNVGVARSVGTTVIVTKLYNSLPVRRVDMKKRLGAQRARLFKLLQGYAVLNVGTRFNVVDVSEGKKGSKKMVTKLATSASKSLKQTVSSVLGAKFLSGLCELNIDISNCFLKDDNNEDNDVEYADHKHWYISGLISQAPTSGKISAARDLQYFAINGRPVELPKFSKTLCDTWRAFEASDSKKPACVLQISLPNGEFDVNLSPDKRDVLLSSERKLCEKLSTALHEIWMQSSAIFRESEVEDMSRLDRKARLKRSIQHNLDEHVVQKNTCERLNTSVSECRDIGENHHTTKSNYETNLMFQSCETPQDLKYQKKTQILKMKKNKQSSSTSKNSLIPLLSLQSFVLNSQSLTAMKELEQGELNEQKKTSISQSEVKEWERVRKSLNSNNENTQNIDISELDISTHLEKFNENSSSEEQIYESNNRKKRKLNSKSNDGSQWKIKNTFVDKKSTQYARETDELDMDGDAIDNLSIDIDEDELTTTQTRKSKLFSASSENSMKDEDHEVYVEQMNSQEKLSLSSKETEKSTNVVWSQFNERNVRDAFWNAKRRKRKLYESLSSHAKQPTTPELYQGTADINLIQTVGESNEPSINEKSNSKRNDIKMSKDEFCHMRIIGQFNLGFILTRCRNNHMWILDQHACDERYNFERLCKATVIHEQRLISPLPLELSASEEDCVSENMETFEKNGFRLHYDESKPPRHRVSLLAIPHSGSGRNGQKSVQFGKEDVGAILYLLGAQGSSSSNDYQANGGTGSDGTGSFGNNAVRRYAGSGITRGSFDKNIKNDTLVRLPKAVAMFASRACRASIMIGTALSKKEMRKLVEKMEEVDLPWSCAHGRPTMRHVKDIRDILIEDAKAEIHTSNPFEVLSQECDDV